MAATGPLVAPPGGSLAESQHRSASGSLTRALDPYGVAVIGLTVLGVVLRVIVAHQSVFADELSTYWISATHGLGGVLSLLYSTGRIHFAEITPPLSFVASWLSTRLGHSPELLRLPALIAGTATIPLVYAVGARALGRAAGLLAATFTTLSPFMIYYSAEARAYGLMMCFVVSAILSLLVALDTGRTRYWVLYAVFSAAAFWTHYTSLFVLGAALLWVLWVHPRARRAALLATGGAALLVVPWIPGLIQDLRSPTVKILSALAQFNVHAVRIDVEHWALGYPYAQSGAPYLVDTGLRHLPGTPALALLAVATALTIGGLIFRWVESRRRLRPSSRMVLMLLLALAALVGECAVSAVGNHIIGVRDLAASWPFLALLCAGGIAAAGPWVSRAAAILAVAAFAIAASKMLEPSFQRPDYGADAAYVAAYAKAGDVVIDATGGARLTPGPLTGFDVASHPRIQTVRALAPAEHDHPFNIFDPVVPMSSAVDQAVSRAAGRRVFLVGLSLPQVRFPAGYRLTAVRHFDGFIRTLVGVYDRPSPTGP